MSWWTKALVYSGVWCFFAVVLGILFAIIAVVEFQVEDTFQLGSLMGALWFDAFFWGSLLIWTFVFLTRTVSVPASHVGPPRSSDPGSSRRTQETAAPDDGIIVVTPLGYEPPPALSATAVADEVMTVTPLPLAAPPVPWSLRTAGVLWMVQGVFVVLASALDRVAPLLFFVFARSGGGISDGPPGRLILAATFAIVFLAGGYRVAKGLSSEPLVMTIFSLLHGTCYVGMGAVAMSLLRARIPYAWVLGLGVIVWGVVFSLLPGMLALAGRSKYLKWRANQVAA